MMPLRRASISWIQFILQFAGAFDFGMLVAQLIHQGDEPLLVES